MQAKPILENEFYQDGRGPELQRVAWKMNGVVLDGFEYYNPNDKRTESEVKHIKLLNVQVHLMASEEVHGNIMATGESRAAIFKVIDSVWIKTFQQIHLAKCSHFQIMFYDEIYDVICESIIAGHGRLN